jgi:hypothetical protein
MVIASRCVTVRRGIKIPLLLLTETTSNTEFGLGEAVLIPTAPLFWAKKFPKRRIGQKTEFLPEIL